jgi:signal transduction histidine kinase/ligand-binding sensor protein
MHQIDQFQEKEIIELEIRNITSLILDVCSTSAKCSFSLYDNNGDGIWSSIEKYLSPLCQYCKNDTNLWELCEIDHKKRACIKRFSNDFNEKLDICHFGLYNLCHPIVINNVFYGSILTGQKRFSSDSNSEEHVVFTNRINELCEKDIINEQQKNVLINLYKKIKPHEEIAPDIFHNIKIIEDNLSKAISNIINRVEKRIRRLTHLKHELHDPNISIKNRMSYSAKQIDFIINNYIVSDDVKLILNDIKTNISYSTNWSVMFSNIIENIAGSMSRDPIKPLVKRNNILTIIKNVINLFKEQAEHKDVVFENRNFNTIDDSNLEIDKTLMTRAFINIYHNAVKYSFWGQKEYGPRKIITEISNFNNTHFKIDISNFGTGILNTEIESKKIWKEGVRGILSSDRHRTGSGLGLNQIMKIIESHNGKVFIKSIPKSDDKISGPYLTTLTIFLTYYYEKGLNNVYNEEYFMG